MKFRCRICGAQFHDTDQNWSQEWTGRCPICGHDNPKFCPRLKGLCIEQACVTWNDYFGMCGMAVPAFLNAREEQRINEEEAKIKTYADECVGRYE